MRAALPSPVQSLGLEDGGGAVAGASRGAGVGTGAGAGAGAGAGPDAGDSINELYISSENKFSGYKKNVRENIIGSGLNEVCSLYIDSNMASAITTEAKSII